MVFIQLEDAAWKCIANFHGNAQGYTNIRDCPFCSSILSIINASEDYEASQAELIEEN